MSEGAFRKELRAVGWFLAITTIVGGVALWVGWITMPLSYLQGSPFSNYDVPAALLTLVVGGAAAVVASIVPIGSLITATGATLVALYVIVALSAIVGRRNGTTAHARYKMPWWPLVPPSSCPTLPQHVRPSGTVPPHGAQAQAGQNRFPCGKAVGREGMDDTGLPATSLQRHRSAREVPDDGGERVP